MKSKKFYKVIPSNLIAGYFEHIMTTTYKKVPVKVSVHSRSNSINLSGLVPRLESRLKARCKEIDKDLDLAQEGFDHRPNELLPEDYYE